MKLVIEQLSKRYGGDVWGLRDINLELEPGIVGLLGPNGAGKTTLMNLLATVTQPTDGKILWNGTDISRSPDNLREVLGYLPQDFGVYPHLNAVEFLEYIAALKGLDRNSSGRRIRELLHLVNLFDARHRPLGGFSGGMRQRVGIAQALLNNPQLLIVDEPTTGLDPEERVRFRNLLSELSGERIVILSTHIVSDVEATATEIAFIRKGHLLRHTSPESLLQSVEGRVWTCVVPSKDLVGFQKRHLVSSFIRRSDGVHVRVVAASPPSDRAKPASPTLEDAYLHFISNAQSEHPEDLERVQ